MSHGYIYKHLPAQGRCVAGKRILCSPHYHRNGCGRTRQLYLADIIPRRRYTLSVVITFIRALLRGRSVVRSFHQAIGTPGDVMAQDARHAWRWLNAFLQSLSAWRTLQGMSWRHEQATSHPKHRSRRVAGLVPTLQLLLPRLSAYHVQIQRAFF